MRLARAFLVAVLLAACGKEPPAGPPVFELADVVAPRIAELAASAAEQAPPKPAEVERAEITGMLESLASPRGEFRDAVLQDLRSRAPAFVPHLASVLRGAEEPAELRAAAAEALAAIDSPASIEHLVGALETAPETWLRAQCAWRLSTTTQDRFLPRILLRLKYERDEETAVWLADVLAHFGNYAGVEGLLVVRDRASTPEMVARAEGRLAELASACGVPDGETVQAQWLAGELEARLPAVAVSPALEREAWTAIQGLAEWNLRIVDDRRFALSNMNAWVVEPLARTLHERNVYLRVHAAQCLERMGPRARAAGPELVLALGEPRLAPAAAAALGALRHGPAAPVLEQLLLGTRDPELATAAARALGRIGEQRSVEPLREIFANREAADLRQAAAEALLGLDQEDLVVTYLAGILTAPRTEATTAEDALGAWLERSAKTDPQRFDAVASAWRALDRTPPGAIPTHEEVQARLRARAELLSTAPR